MKKDASAVSKSIGATVAVLGGGQLGTMLATAAQPLRIQVHCLDPSGDAPASYNAQSFAEGDFTDRRTVEGFARHADVCTIEIEAVSTEGMKALRDNHHIAVHPRPEAVQLIQDKGSQKQFFEEHRIPTAPFELWDGPAEILAAVERKQLSIPFVQKMRRGGYDGKGVHIVRGEADLNSLLPGPSLTEKLAPYTHELAVVAARSTTGEVATYPTVEMVFDPEENLVTELVSPARVADDVDKEAQRIAQELIVALDICGLLAVEFFLLDSGELWVNEVAPRPHNSGHVTMNGFATSQFEQHLRAILGLPLGSTVQYQPAVMINVLGEPGYTGPASYEGLEAILAIPGVHPHLYGKSLTKPHRKMGHINIVAESIDSALITAQHVRRTLKVTSANPQLA